MKKFISVLIILCFGFNFFPNITFPQIEINTGVKVYASATHTPTPLPTPSVEISQPTSSSFLVNQSVPIEGSGSNCNSMACHITQEMNSIYYVTVSNVSTLSRSNNFSGSITFSSEGEYIINLIAGNSNTNNVFVGISRTITITKPTSTPRPTNPPTPTSTPAPTFTPKPTSTPTNSPTPTNTPTNTPGPTNTPTATPIPSATPTSTPIPTPLNVNGQANGYISVTGEVDNYSIPVFSIGTKTITIELNNVYEGNDFTFYVSSSKGYVFPTIPPYRRVQFTGEAGINYYIHVYSLRDMFDVTHSYNINVQCTSYVINELHSGANGIDSATGNYSHTFTDMVIPESGADLIIGRTYNSRDDREGVLGKGWTFSFEGSVQYYKRYCYKSDGNYGYVPDYYTKVVRLPDGSAETFSYDSSHNTFAARDSRDTLEYITNDSKYVLTTKEHKKYEFDDEGYLTGIIDNNNNRITIERYDDPSSDLTITDWAGRKITLRHEPNRDITVKDESSGRTVTYKFTNDNMPLLYEAYDPTGKCMKYEYDNRDSYGGFLNKVTDKRNKVVESVVYTNITGDFLPYVSTRTDNNNNTYTYSYERDSNSTTITDSKDRHTTQTYDANLNIVSTRYPDSRTSFANYNEFGEVNWEIDRTGNKTSYGRDDNGNVTKVTNISDTNNTNTPTPTPTGPTPTGPTPTGSCSYSYDTNNNLSTEVDEEGRYTFYFYDSNNNLTKKVQPLTTGITTYVQGQSNDNNYAIIGYTYYSTLQWGTYSMLHVVTDANGNTTTYAYTTDTRGERLMTVTAPTDAQNPAESKTTYHYNEAGFVDYTKSPKGCETDNTYDANGNIKKTVTHGDEGDIISRITHDAMGNKTQEISPKQYNSSYDGLTSPTPVDTYNDTTSGTRYAYNDAGYLYTVTDAEGNITEYTYDEYGNKHTEIKPNDSEYIYEYDNMSRPSNIYFKDSKNDSDTTKKLLKHYAYSVIPVTISGKTVNEQQVTETTYMDATYAIVTVTTNDYAGRVISQEVNSNSHPVSTEYNKNGTIKTTTDAKGSVTTYTYDGMNRLKTKVAPFEFKQTTSTTYYNTTIYYYDKNGNITTQETSCNKPGETEKLNKTVNDYNSRNQLVKITTYDNENPVNYTQYVYDEAGNKIRMYTGLHSPLTITGIDTVSGTDTKYSVTQYDYNVLNQLVTMTDPLGKEETYQYDSNGNLHIKTDRNNNITTMNYDNLNRLTYRGVRINTGTTDSQKYSYSYYKDIGIEDITDDDNKSYTYTKLGKMDTETDNTTGITKTYTYDWLGNRTSFILEKSNTEKINTTYEYDTFGRLWKVHENGTLSAIYTYDDNGNRYTLEHSNGVTSGTPNEITTTTYGYNLANKLTTLMNKKGTQTLSQYTYTYYLDGNQASKSDAVGNATEYEYDGLGRLTSEIEEQNSNVTSTTTYTYDDSNNRDTMAETSNGIAGSTGYEYDLNNRLSTEKKETGDVSEVTSYQYDGNGNQTFKSTGTEIPCVEGDVENFGVTISGTDSDGSETFSDYDLFNRLIQVATGITIASYTYGDDGLRTSKTVNGVTDNQIWDGDQLVLETDASWNVTAKYVRGINLIYSEDGAATKKYYLFNGHGDVVQLTDSTGNVVKCYSYDAFGNETNIKYDGKGTYSDNFTDGYADGWTTYGGTWSVQNEGYDTSSSTTGPKSIVDGASGSDFTYEADVKILNDGGSGDSGIIFRVTNPSTGADLFNGYYAGLQVYSQRLVLAKMDGASTLLTAISMTVANNIVYHLKVVTNGSNIKVYVNDVLKLDFTDTTYTSGSFGVRSYNAHANFDNIVVNGVTYIDSDTNPFRYCGEYFDKETGTIYLRARYYDPGIGRFTSEDSYWGKSSDPLSLNLYTYCQDNPISYIDPSGNDCYIFYDPNLWGTGSTNKLIEQDKKLLETKYGTPVHMIIIDDKKTFADSWNNMGNVDGEKVTIDAVIIMAHGDPTEILLCDGSYFNTRDSRKLLKEKNIKTPLVILGCNCGHLGYDDNIARAFAKKVKSGLVIASDGTVYHDFAGLLGWLGIGTHRVVSRGDDIWKDYAADSGHNSTKNCGFVLFSWWHDKYMFYSPIGTSFNDIGQLIDAGVQAS